MSNFSISVRNHDLATVLHISGFLDAHTAPQLESRLESLIKDGVYKLVVNFDELDYISSAGLGVFMVFIEEIRSNEGDIKLVQMKPKVFTVFDLLGFPMLFDILDNEDEAFVRFNEKGGSPGSSSDAEQDVNDSSEIRRGPQ